jgi:AcrR family transcriptional regulator
LSSAYRIRLAALRCFASVGSEATSLKAVAEAAGVSIGLVQHHFGSKAHLVAAVDDYVLTVIRTTMADPLPRASADPIGGLGERLGVLLAEHPDVVDYLGRSLVTGTEVGASVFDRLAAIGIQRWAEVKKNDLNRPDLDDTWCVLNPLILVLGTILLREHVERQLPDSFTSEAQLQRWQRAFNQLVVSGQLQLKGSRNGRSDD